jgi:long-chain fatty acid transport protein
LTTVDIGPSLSIKATDRLRVGIGVDAQYAKASLSNAIDFSSVCLAQAAIVTAFALQCAGAGLTTPGDPAHDGKANLSADSWGWGWNLECRLRTAPRYLARPCHRSKVSHTFSGDASFDKPAGLPAAVAAAAAATSTAAKIDLDVPESVYLTFQTALTEQLGVQAAVLSRNQVGGFCQSCSSDNVTFGNRSGDIVAVRCGVSTRSQVLRTGSR